MLVICWEICLSKKYQSVAGFFLRQIFCLSNFLSGVCFLYQGQLLQHLLQVLGTMFIQVCLRGIQNGLDLCGLGVCPSPVVGCVMCSGPTNSYMSLSLFLNSQYESQVFFRGIQNGLDLCGLGVCPSPVVGRVMCSGPTNSYESQPVSEQLV